MGHQEDVAVIAIRFIVGGVSTVTHWQSDRALQFTEVSRHMPSKKTRFQLYSNFGLKQISTKVYCQGTANLSIG